MSTKQVDTISLEALDSLLYGAAKAFSYLGDEGPEMLDKIGSSIVEYLVDKGFLQKSNDVQILLDTMKFFRENGYIGDARFEPKGEGISITMGNWRFLRLMKNLRNRGCYLITCPLCLANDSIRRSNAIGWRRLRENISGGDTYVVDVEMVPGDQETPIASRLADLTSVPAEYGGDQVGIGAFEAVWYGFMRGFDYLGAQAELFLNTIGLGVLEFLREEAGFQPPNDLGEAADVLARFFTKNGLADSIDVQLSQSEVRVKFKNYRYAPTLKQGLSEGFRSVSCPFLLALKASIRAQGRTVEESKWTFGEDRNADLTMKLRQVTEEFDEEKASALMG